MGARQYTTAQLLRSIERDRTRSAERNKLKYVVWVPGMRIGKTELQKLKYIAWYYRCSCTEVLARLRTIANITVTSLEDAVTAWEKANKPITPKMLEEAKIK